MRARHSEKEDDDFGENDVKEPKDMISLDISILINVDKNFGLKKVWNVILCKKRKTRKIILYLNSLNVYIV